MKYPISSLQADIKNCIEMCNAEITKRKNGINGESTLEQLESVILPELKELLKRIEENNLPIQSERYLNSFAYAFKVWGWNMETPSALFIKLTEINNNYGQLEE